MDVRTGDILTQEDMLEFADLSAVFAEHFPWLKQMKIAATQRQLSRKPFLRPPVLQASGRVGRNEPCPCGSGKKFKKCCMEV